MLCRVVLCYAVFFVGVGCVVSGAKKCGLIKAGEEDWRDDLVREGMIHVGKRYSGFAIAASLLPDDGSERYKLHEEVSGTLHVLVFFFVSWVQLRFIVQTKHAFFFVSELTTTH